MNTPYDSGTGLSSKKGRRYDTTHVLQALPITDGDRHKGIITKQYERSTTGRIIEEGEAICCGGEGSARKLH